MSQPPTGGAFTGRVFGHYRVTRPLGRGGMGEVYLALDTRLGRQVALKFLPRLLDRDDSDVRRFEQEAFAASALNHPNIVTVFEFGADQGEQYLVTEYVQGQTLREVLHQPTFRPEDALRIAGQVALALSAAHKAGIIHRDVKPENVMVREDGIVKVLDFGLAKLASPVPGDEAALTRLPADSERETRQHVTVPGSLLGTVLYMSPEQARGKEVDGRTDVWSLGVVIYEMVAGLPPFVGETSSDVIAAILVSEAPPLVSRLGALPDGVGRVVEKALRKDRDQRYQDMNDLVNDLRDAERQLYAQQATASAVEQAATVATPQPGRSEAASPPARASRTRTAARPPARFLLGLVGAVAAVLAGYWLLAPARPGTGAAPAPLRPARAPVTLTPVGIEGDVREAVISADGRLVAYVKRDGLHETTYVQPAEGGPAVAVVPPREAGWRGLAFSPDGSRLLLRTNQPTTSINELYEVPVGGGRLRKVITDVDSIVSFAPGGNRVVFRRNYPDRRESSIIVANLDGSGERTLATRQIAQGFLNNPAWSPDGRIVASLVQDPGAGDEQQRGVVVIDAVNGTLEVLGRARWRWTRALKWAPDGSELLVNGKDQANAPFQVWRVGYPAGDVLNATKDANDYDLLSVSAEGPALLTVKISETSALLVAPLADPDEARRVHPAPDARIYGLDWARDGRILYGSSAGGQRSIWVTTVDGSRPARLTTDGFVSENPVATPDGRHVVYQSEQGGYANIWRIGADGSDPRQLTFGETATSPSVTPDGRWVVYDAASVGATRLFKVPFDGGTPEELTTASSHYPVVSPDGKAIAFLYYSGGTAVSSLSIVGIEGGTPRQVYRVTADAWRWEPGGRALIYVDNVRSRFMRLPLDTGTPTPIAAFSGGRIVAFDLSPDGKHVVFVRVATKRDVVRISGFR